MESENFFPSDLDQYRFAWIGCSTVSNRRAMGIITPIRARNTECIIHHDSVMENHSLIINLTRSGTNPTHGHIRRNRYNNFTLAPSCVTKEELNYLQH